VSEDEEDAPHPRATEHFHGHPDAECILLDSYRSGRIPHAWLIGGPRGVGKATLAYRLARFVLAHPDPAAPAVQSATSLAVAPGHATARRIANEAHPDLLVLERTINEKTGKLHQDITVDQIRRSVGFFGSTAGEGGWRVAIIDTLDELNRSGENALLKVLEEPPDRCLVLLITNAPGRVLPTIRSRCRFLPLHALASEDVARAAAAAAGRTADDPEIVAAAEAANGSVARAFDLLDGATMALLQKILDLLGQLPQPDPRALHALGDAISGTDPRKLGAFIDVIDEWLSATLDRGSIDTPRLARVAEAWEKINRAANDAQEYNLERKPLVFAVFGLLAQAARG
jgi:DNA polymerase-3 subunit delta'